MGAYFLNELQKIDHPAIKEVRGCGLMIAIELKENSDMSARQVCEQLMKMQILCKETHTYTIRFAPPLIINKDEVDFVLDKIRCVFGA